MAEIAWYRRQQNAERLESRIEVVARQRGERALPQSCDRMFPKKSQLAQQFGDVKGQLECRAGRVVMVRAAGMHLHQFINGTLPPCQSFRRGAHLPLRRQGIISVVLQAHQPLAWRYTVDFWYAHTMPAQVLSHSEKIGDILGLPGCTHHHDA